MTFRTRTPAIKDDRLIREGDIEKLKKKCKEKFYFEEDTNSGSKKAKKSNIEKQIAKKIRRKIKTKQKDGTA